MARVGAGRNPLVWRISRLRNIGAQCFENNIHPDPIAEPEAVCQRLLGTVDADRNSVDRVHLICAFDARLSDWCWRATPERQQRSHVHLLAFFIRKLISHGLATAALSAHTCHLASRHLVHGLDLVRCKVGRTGGDDSQRPRFGKGVLIGGQEGEVPVVLLLAS
jgi:hypothetical protein